MRWKKLGRVFVPDGSLPWARSHAMIPTPLDLGDGLLRIYYAATDEHMVGRIGYVELNVREPIRVRYNNPGPVLDIGEPGCFDDNGVNPISIVRTGDQIYLYYVGYQLGVHVRYFLFSGLAISDDGGRTFRRHQRVPIMERSDSETLVRTAPFVLKNDSIWKMWYVGGDRFVQAGDRMRPSYVLRYLESPDGIHWGAEGKVVMPLSEGEFGLGRPFVILEEDRMRMWYSVRTVARGYRLGYAESPDGLRWTRMDERVGIDVSPSGWDSEMVCYGCIVPTPSSTLMFYNGNDYGRTGFGVAVLED